MWIKWSLAMLCLKKQIASLGRSPHLHIKKHIHDMGDGDILLFAKICAQI